MNAATKFKSSFTLIAMVFALFALSLIFIPQPGFAKSASGRARNSGSIRSSSRPHHARSAAHAGGKHVKSVSKSRHGIHKSSADGKGASLLMSRQQATK